ncbi:MAG: YlbF family regulator [Calditerricola sp.]|nr:YlbF family regulator [Calditerricola sp.]
MPSLDMAHVIRQASELGELILASREAKEYVRWKAALARDARAQTLIRRFQAKKREYEDVMRYGRYHPDYSRVVEETRALKRELDELETVSRFRQAEARLDALLYEVSKTIAHAVSPNIKVPGNNPVAGLGCGSSGCGGGCGSGGCCAT